MNERLSRFDTHSESETFFQSFNQIQIKFFTQIGPKSWLVTFNINHVMLGSNFADAIHFVKFAEEILAKFSF